MSTSIKLSKTKLICLLLFFSLQIYNTSQSVHRSGKGYRIPLYHSSHGSKNHGPRFARRNYTYSDNFEEGVHYTNFSFYLNLPADANVIFDTTISDSWIYSKKYDFCDEFVLQVRRKHRLLDPWDNQRTDQPQLIFNQGGWVFGFTANNISLILPEDPFGNSYHRFAMSFVEVKHAAKEMVDQPFDATIGIGPKSPIWNACKELNKTQTIAIALPTLREVSTSSKGELILCGSSPSLYTLKPSATPVTMPVVDNSSWTVNFHSIEFDKFAGDLNKRRHVLAQKQAVTFDFNTPYFSVPPSVIEKYKALWEVTEDPTTHELQLDCLNIDLLPVLLLNATESQQFALWGSEYTLRKRLPDNNFKCVVLFRVSEYADYAMGDIFIRKYHTQLYSSASQKSMNFYDPTSKIFNT